jgi:D-alanyl-D-alanine carboxypeptidase
MRVLIAAIALALAVSATPALAQGGQLRTRCADGRRVTGGDICLARGSSQATEILDAVREVKDDNPITGLVFGVWTKGKEVISGALGEALPGVPATRRDHFRVGNVCEAMLTTRLLQLVDEKKLSLDDKLSEWFPDFPDADEVTLEMLARSTSGYGDFVTSDEFNTAFEDDPFRQWTPEELLDIAAGLPPVFAPGTDWAFSDTNFVLLGQVLEQVDGPVSDQYQQAIYNELGLTDTRVTPTAEMLSPVLHSYSAERGANEDATFWSPSWVPNAGDMSSNVTDMRKWATALGEGTVLTKKSHDEQVSDALAGVGPFTEDLYYAMGFVSAEGWLLNNPQIDGYTGVVAYLPSQKTAVVVSATFGPEAPPGFHYAALVFNRIAEIVSPDNLPDLQVQPRGASNR